jgi:hypothetical protein
VIKINFNLERLLSPGFPIPSVLLIIKYNSFQASQSSTTQQNRTVVIKYLGEQSWRPGFTHGDGCYNTSEVWGI